MGNLPTENRVASSRVAAQGDDARVIARHDDQGIRQVDQFEGALDRFVKSDHLLKRQLCLCLVISRINTAACQSTL